MNPVRQILVAFTNGNDQPLGQIWRFTSKKVDFYLDPEQELDVYHLSVHAAQGKHKTHLFKLTFDEEKAKARVAAGDFIASGIPDCGYLFPGKKLDNGVFQVARVRFVWDLQRSRYSSAARMREAMPEITEGRSGAKLSHQLDANFAADLDIVVSFNDAYWPGNLLSEKDNARLGPLRNNAGMWLTVTSYRRSLTMSPFPERLVPRLPRPGEEPIRFMCAGPRADGAGEMYWFVNTITSREALEPLADGTTLANYR